MANTTVSERLAGVPLRNLKAQSSELQNLTARGALVDQARKNAGIEVKQMAEWMGVSESFLQRGFKDQEHISWQRLRAVSAKSAKFHQEFLIVQAAEAEGVEVITEIRVRRRA